MTDKLDTRTRIVLAAMDLFMVPGGILHALHACDTRGAAR